MKLYVHVPFCRSKCAYCDFYSTPRREWMEAYADAIANEWNERSKAHCEKAAPTIDGAGTICNEVDTLYFGGGTPSSLPLGLLDCIVGSLSLPAALREATIEANPEDVTPEWTAHIMSATPFRRVSMGVQSFNDRELAAVGRRHSAADAERAFRTLRDGGLDNISCDLIYGLPGQDIHSWKSSLERLISLRPEHISAYLLSYEPGTRLSAMLSKGKVTEADEQTAEQMYTLLCDKLRETGYRHYEISNFALPGREAIHNSAYWDGSDYIGLGPGAHSCIGSVRSFNPSSLKDYIACGGHGFGITEEEDILNRYNDMLLTGLRTASGLHPDRVLRAFGANLADAFCHDCDMLVRKKLLTISPDGAYVIPEQLWLRSNPILLELIKVHDT